MKKIEKEKNPGTLYLNYSLQKKKKKKNNNNNNNKKQFTWTWWGK